MHGIGCGIVMHNNYTIRSLITPESIGFVPDLHEVNIINHGRSALITSYQALRYDLAEFNLTNGIGWILDSLFYEIDLQTNRILFKWSALDHVHPSNS
jgi:hypothetical protein